MGFGAAFLDALDLISGDASPSGQVDDAEARLRAVVDRLAEGQGADLSGRLPHEHLVGFNTLVRYASGTLDR